MNKIKNYEWYKNQPKNNESEIILSEEFGNIKFENQTSENVSKIILPYELEKTLYVKTMGLKTIPQAELLFSYFAKEIGLDVVEVVPAVVEKSNGSLRKAVIIEDYLDNREIQKDIFAVEMTGKVDRELESIELYYNSALEYAEKLSKQLNKQVVVEKDLKEKLEQRFIVDFLTLNTDHQNENTLFVLTNLENKATLTLGKCFDNGFAFGLRQFKELNSLYRDPILDFIDYDGLVKDSTNIYYTCKLKSEDGKNYEDIKKQVAKLVIENENHMKFLHRIKQVDIKKLINQIETDYAGYEFDSDDYHFAFFARATFNKTLRELEQEIVAQKYQNQNQDQGLSR